MPGDISRLTKIALLEDRPLDLEELRRKRSFKMRILMKERAVLKQRFLKMMEDA
jgi:hypothetical protein